VDTVTGRRIEAGTGTAGADAVAGSGSMRCAGAGTTTGDGASRFRAIVQDRQGLRRDGGIAECLSRQRPSHFLDQFPMDDDSLLRPGTRLVELADPRLQTVAGLHHAAHGLEPAPELLLTLADLRLDR
jgi:hypothetical protein